ncbi:ADAMTS-like protein 5 isoform X2 [Pantherophis guttatus]|uniref:ADAMTS-like protein 5 isoform X2 n=1 Tax=Pantherophis guttatus TaxID=94885 RepID=A0A6P9CPH7_PANGU|nr:ADAMTS-like protein 5 isoform X2 [Pantherophis guttatus]
MKPQGERTDSCPRCHSRPRGLWVMQPRGPASDVLSFWQLSHWRVLLLIGLVFACTVQGRNNGPLDLDLELEPQHRQQPTHGTWTHWGSWSACSSTCGDGVSFRIRRCIRLPGEEPCQAEARQYRICEQKACPAGTVPFRAMQCALYNSRPILGGQAQYQWVPFHGGFFGYRNVTQISAGARQIRVIDNSRNYLALMKANQHYVLNGEWAVDQPGAFEAAGTQWHYTRTANGHETLEAAGPTSDDLFVMVLCQEEDLSIDYQYWGPRKQTLHRAQGEAHALRQPQAREVEAQHPEEPADFPEATAATRHFAKAEEVAKEAPQVTPAPLRTPTAPGPCGKCDPPRGKSQRLHHYCNSDFVFRARILSKRYVGSETRYDVQVQQTYRNRYPLRSREYLWVPNTCDCPHLLERREYLLMTRNHVNFEQTLNRLLLQRGGYARPWSPREDLLLRDAALRCQPGPPA